MKKKKILWKRVVATVAGVAIAVTLLTGADDNKILVEDVYTVKAGDTLRDIAWQYLEKNTAEDKYILEFEHEILELNPELRGAQYIYPNQQIRIQYWVREGE